MSFNHEAVAALPTAANADAALIRAMCERRFAYALTASESAQNLVAIDPTSGVIPLYLLQNSTLFAYDSTDSTTVHDGVTCLVSSDGKRFKSGTISPPYSVLSRTTTAQPSSPAVGSRYLIPTAATGTDWAGKDGQIGIYTAAGWRFAVSPIGRFLYVENETAFYHRNAAGTWTAGVGSVVLGANSVNLTNVLGAKASFVIKVENQTTNAPPVSPTAPTAYIIGPSPTGAWAGNAGKLAICLANGTFTIVTPDAGDTVYDKTKGQSLRFNGTAWISSAGAVLNVKRIFTAASAVMISGSGPVYTYDPAIAPGSEIRDYDPVTLSYTAIGGAGAVLEFTYSAVLNPSAATSPNFALKIDSVTLSVDWMQFAMPAGQSYATFTFLTTAPDALSHVYTFYAFRSSIGLLSAVSRRMFKVTEFS